MNSFREALEAMSAVVQVRLGGNIDVPGLAMLCGCEGEPEIVHWGQSHRWTLAEWLGFKPYRMETIQPIVHQLDGERFAQRVGAWGQRALVAYRKHLVGKVLMENAAWQCNQDIARVAGAECL
jgi:hypothetical protein